MGGLENRGDASNTPTALTTEGSHPMIFVVV
jgi:hypothetical protein